MRMLLKRALASRSGANDRKGDDTVGNPPRARILHFELFELKFLNSSFSSLSSCWNQTDSSLSSNSRQVERFEATESQSAEPSPPLKWATSVLTPLFPTTLRIRLACVAPACAVAIAWDTIAHVPLPLPNPIAEWSRGVRFLQFWRGEMESLVVPMPLRARVLTYTSVCVSARCGHVPWAREGYGAPAYIWLWMFNVPSVDAPSSWLLFWWRQLLWLQRIRAQDRWRWRMRGLYVCAHDINR